MSKVAAQHMLRGGGLLPLAALAVSLLTLAACGRGSHTVEVLTAAVPPGWPSYEGAGLRIAAPPRYRQVKQGQDEIAASIRNAGNPQLAANFEQGQLAFLLVSETSGALIHAAGYYNPPVPDAGSYAALARIDVRAHGGKILERKSVRLQGVDGEMLYIQSPGDEEWSYLEYIFFTSGKMWLVYYEAQTALFKGYRPDFEASAASIRFE